MPIDLSNPEESVKNLKADSLRSDVYSSVADAMVKALLEDGRKLKLRMNKEGDRYTNLESVLDKCHDVLDKFNPSCFQAGWAVKVAFQLRPYWDVLK